jgi:indolepyruvate ferredoxin oxidoreductase
MAKFKKRLREEFDGDFRIPVNLAPQLFNSRDPMTGRARKFEIPFGLIGPAFAVLSALRRVRGTPLDIFGKTKHRREERARIEDYKRQILGVLANSAPTTTTRLCSCAARCADPSFTESQPRIISGIDAIRRRLRPQCYGFRSAR